MHNPRDTASPSADRIAGRANVTVYEDLDSADYLDGAPHLKHATIRALYSRLADEAMMRTGGGAVCRVLDLGAGEGSATLQFLSAGAQVTAVDSSARQLRALEHRAGPYRSSLRVRHGDVFEVLAAERTVRAQYDIVVANSFLHHIPDYSRVIQEATALLSPQGVFFSFQDLLRFSSIGLFARAFSNLAYFSWRVARPDAVRGIGRRLRRLAGIYYEDSAEDNAEYHVVRDGVDQDAIRRQLEAAGMEVRVERYYSTQSPMWQSLGDRLGVQNTFAIMAQRGHGA